MARAPTYTGESTQGDSPNWQPLLDAVGGDVVQDFMWMFEVTLCDGTQLQAYKHIDTRRYVHLARGGRAFVYESPDRYRPAHPADALAAVFSRLIGLAGVTGEQVAASWAAVERARRR